jgi:magnesium-transporting ATPase (P-type)
MKLADMIQALRENLKTLKIALIVYLAVLVVFDFFPSRAHAHYLIDKIYSWWAMFGTVGCFLLIKFSKGVAHMFLSKDENFYD